MSTPVPKHEKYVPKHRQAPPTTIVKDAPKKVLRNTVMLSSVAVAATGVAVSGGVLASPARPASATRPQDLGAPLGRPAERQPTRRAPHRQVSRSADRRDAADPAKAGRPGRRRRPGDDPPREHRRRRPARHRPGAAAAVRLLLRPVRLPGLAVGGRERLARRRRQPDLLGLRHPAGAARLQDGLGRPRLGDQPGHPDHVGPRLHPGPLRLALRRLGFKPATAGTDRRSASTRPRSDGGSRCVRRPRRP